MCLVFSRSPAHLATRDNSGGMRLDRQTGFPWRFDREVLGASNILIFMEIMGPIERFLVRRGRQSS